MFRITATAEVKQRQLKEMSVAELRHGVSFEASG